MLIFDTQGGLYLKKREIGEDVSQVEKDAWSGRLHIPGTTYFPNAKYGSNLYRLISKEVVGGDGSTKRKRAAEMYKGCELIGSCAHPEPARRTDGKKEYYQIVIDDPSILKSGYERVDVGDPEQLGKVIDDHKEPIRKILKHKKLVEQGRRRGPMIIDARI